MAGRLIDLVPREEEITQIDAPRTSAAMRAITSALLQLRSAVQHLAEAQDTANGQALVLAARLEELRDTVTRVREGSSHDIQVVRGDLKEAVMRAMTEQERTAFEAQQLRARTLREQLMVIAAIGTAGWPVLAALAWAVWYVWHHLN